MLQVRFTHKDAQGISTNVPEFDMELNPAEVQALLNTDTILMRKKISEGVTFPTFYRIEKTMFVGATKPAHLAIFIKDIEEDEAGTLSHAFFD